MFANEERKAVNTTVVLPCVGKYARLDLANEKIYGGSTDNGEITLSLEPSQSNFFIFGDNTRLEKERALEKSVMLSPDYDL
jgi:hypothetical protein